MFTDGQVLEAIRRLPSQSNDQVKAVLRNAQRLGIEKLEAACLRELTTRGCINLSAADAQRANEQATSVANKPLKEVIAAAFTAIPPSEFELVLLRIIHANPDAVYSDIEAAYGRKDTSLSAGHFVFDRFGFFRRFMDNEKDQSSILLKKGKRDGHVTWRLKEEAAEAFRKLGVL